MTQAMDSPTYMERTQRLWDKYLETCREYDLLDKDDRVLTQQRNAIGEKKVALLKRINIVR